MKVASGIKGRAGLNIYSSSLLEEQAVDFQFQELVISLFNFKNWIQVEFGTYFEKNKDQSRQKRPCYDVTGQTPIGLVSSLWISLIFHPTLLNKKQRKLLSKRIKKHKISLFFLLSNVV